MDVMVSRECSLMDSDAVKSHTYVMNIQLHGMNLKITALKIPNRYPEKPPSFSLQWHTRLKVDKHYMFKANLRNEALLLKTVID